MSQSSFSARNIKENHPDFALKDISQQSKLFKKGFLSQTLDPINNNLEPGDLENYRTVTVKCLIKGCK